MTPGPWKSLGSPSCKVVRDQYVGRDGGVAQAVNPEDAALIAAAPELLDTLRWFAQTVHQAYHEGEPANCSQASCKAALDVIAKAGG